MAEVEAEKDVDVEDKTQHAATDIISATHPIFDSQGSHKPFPVNILLDTGFIGPDENYIHKDIFNTIDPLNLVHSKRSTHSICSGSDNSCVANSSYTYITVMLTKLIFITIKCFILSTTPLIPAKLKRITYLIDFRTTLGSLQRRSTT